MLLRHTIDGVTYTFDSLKDLLAKATTARSGDELAGIAARSSVERVADQQVGDSSLPILDLRRRDGAHPSSPIPSPLLWSGRSSPTNSGSEDQLFRQEKRFPRRRALHQ
jgi:hypothetical protein